MEKRAQAKELGIAVVFQILALVECLDVAANMYLGRPLRKARFFADRRAMINGAADTLAELKVRVPSVRVPVGVLSGGQRQGVAIARAMHFKSKILVLDEPTNHLSVKETNKVIGFVKNLKAQNLTGIFISHNMQHVFQSCDRVVAMARGEIVFDSPIHATSIEQVHEYL